MTNIQEELDIKSMQEAALLFNGEHNYMAYCYKANKDSQYVRTIDFAAIEVNKEYTASFFPKTSYVFKVRGKGFGRNQIRLMMGALIRLGKGDLTKFQIEESLKTGILDEINFIAPASGLILHSISFQK